MLEAEEFFAKGQKGSSAMPHKLNPITGERLTGLARVLRANALVGFENQPLWHERDISHSSAERVVLPDSTIGLDYVLDRFTWVVDGLVVFPEVAAEVAGGGEEAETGEEVEDFLRRAFGQAGVAGCTRARHRISSESRLPTPAIRR